MTSVMCGIDTPPLQGFDEIREFSQGVALGWNIPPHWGLPKQ